MFVDDANTQFFERADALSVDEAKATVEQLRGKLNELQTTDDKNATAWVLLHIALVFIGQRHYEGVLEMLTDSSERFTSAANDVGLGCAILATSICNREMNQNAVALKEATRAVQLLQPAGEHLPLALAYDNLARIYLNRLQRHESLLWAKKAQSIFVKIKSKLGFAWNMCNLGGLYVEMGFYTEALELYQQALILFEEINHNAGRAWVILGLGMLHRARCDFASAERYLEKAQVLFEELNLKDRAGWSLLNRAAVQRLLGRWDDAIVMNKKAMRIFAGLRNNDGVAWALFQLGQIASDRGFYVKSWETLREGLNLHIHIANPAGIGWGENEMGRVYLNLCNLALARESFVKVKVTADQIDAPVLKAAVDLNLAHYYLDQGMIRKSFDSLGNAESVSAKVNAQHVEIEILLCRIRYALVIRDLPLARAAMAEAQKILTMFGMVWIKSHLDLAHAELLLCDSKPEEALTLFRHVELSAAASQSRHTSLEAKLGCLQLERHQHAPATMASLLQIFEKNARLLGSHKLKAKSAALKAVAFFESTKQNDLRLQQDVLDMLDQNGLVLLRWQCLHVFAELCRQEGSAAPVKAYLKQIEELEANTAYDIRFADSRLTCLQQLPISIIA